MPSSRARALALLVWLVACGGTPSRPVEDTGVDATADPSDAFVPVDAARPRDSSYDALGASDAGPGARVERVVVIGIDGLGGRWVTPELAPTIAALAATGTRTNAMQNALPTTSSTNWMSMISGVHPQRHGVLSNGWMPGDSTPPPTMFAALRAAHPSARIGIFHEWSGFGRLVEPGVADVMTSPGAHDATTDAAIAFVQEGPFELLFVHLDLVDHAGHFYSWGSPRYLAAVAQADALVSRIIAAVEDAGLRAGTAFVVSADHGGVAFSHGDDTAVERATPFVVAGPQIPAIDVTREVRIWDIAPTVLRLLGVAAPAEWIASPIVEAFGGLSPADAPTDPLVLVRSTGYDLAYDSSGSGAAETVSIWHPSLAAGDASLGDLATSTLSMPAGAAWTTPSTAPGVRAPLAYELIWDDRASDGAHPGSIWSPIPPLGYVCLGDVAVAGYDTPPPLDAVRCVHLSYVVPTPSPATRTWSDTGSGATLPASVYGCSESTETPVGTFYARRHDASDPGTDRCHALLSARVMMR